MGGELKDPGLIVVHYTAGGSDAGAIQTLTASDEVYVSAHFIVGREGLVAQLVPLDRVAYHAGKSVWKGREGCNQFSIGIELSNWGPLRARDGKWWAWPGGFRRFTVPEDMVYLGPHRNGKGESAWEAYPKAQMDALARLCVGLRRALPSLREVAGHDWIAPDRKQDPGPAFSYTDLRGRMSALAPELPELGGAS